MLTRLEINGFKSFHNFAIDFLPFQVFIGPNGVGKTNLFDAIALLSDLAGENTLDGAIRHNRGELAELFTLYSDGTRAKTMSFAAEMLIERTTTGAAGRSLDLTTTRLRYELSIEALDDGRPHVLREGLTPIKDSDDKWVKEHIPAKSRKAWIAREKRPPYIATVEDDKGKATVFRNQDGIAGGREGALVGTIERTMLSSADGVRFPTINAVRNEMLNWRLMQLNPSALRKPARTDNSAKLVSDGSNLAAVLSRVAGEGALPAVIKDMKGLIPAIADITVHKLADQNEFLIEITTQDKSRFSSRVLSDGTLRLLTFVTLKNDAQHRGLLCYEEPENGVQPLRLKQIIDMLYSLSTNISEEREPGEDGKPAPAAPLRQVLVTTHSPGLLAHVPADTMFYVDMKLHDRGHCTRVIPVRSELLTDDQERYYTWGQVEAALVNLAAKSDL